MFHRHNYYITYNKSSDVKKTESISVKNFIQPIFVKKSYLYLGIPPLTKTSKAIKNINLIAKIIALMMFVLNLTKKNKLNTFFVKIKKTEYKTVIKLLVYDSGFKKE